MRCTPDPATRINTGTRGDRKYALIRPTPPRRGRRVQRAGRSSTAVDGRALKTSIVDHTRWRDFSQHIDLDQLRHPYFGLSHRCPVEEGAIEGRATKRGREVQPGEVEMAVSRFFKTHHTWEDGLGIVLGVLIGLAPWLAGQTESLGTIYNAALVGVLVLALASLELVDLRRWEEIAETVCGLWLIASPFVLGYAAAGALRYWHLALGAMVVLLAAAELWQDWKLNDRELAHHGQ
jgi:hypothetical protein